MGEKIIFPKNYEHYVKKAVDAFQLGHMEEAIPFFKEAYQIKQEDKINTFYATALYQVGRYQDAKQVAEDRLYFYENEEQLYAFYTSILIRAHYFIQAEAIIKKQLNRKDIKVDSITWQSLMGFSKEEQKNFQIQEAKRILDISKQIMAISDKSYQEQAFLINEMQTLPFKDYLQLAKQLLSNPFINNPIKATLLERLVEENIHEELTIVWFQQERRVIPSQLTSLKEDPTAKAVLKLLEELLETNNPSLYEAVSQEAHLHFILLYPFIEEVIVQPATWVHLYLKQYDLAYQQSEEKFPDESNEVEWMARLNQQILELMD